MNATSCTKSHYYQHLGGIFCVHVQDVSPTRRSHGTRLVGVAYLNGFPRMIQNHAGDVTLVSFQVPQPQELYVSPFR